MLQSHLFQCVSKYLSLMSFTLLFRDANIIIVYIKYHFTWASFYNYNFKGNWKPKWDKIWNLKLCWFISLPPFLSHHNKIWNERLKSLKQQTSCSSVTAQADRRGIVYSLELGAANLKRVIMIPLGFSLFILPISYFWLYPVQNRTCTHHQLRKRMKMNIIMLLVVSTCD